MPDAATLRSSIVPKRRVHSFLLRMITSTNSDYFLTQHQLIVFRRDRRIAKSDY